jgi:hypothetical protein
MFFSTQVDFSMSLENPSFGSIRKQTGLTRRSWLARAGQGFGLLPLWALEQSKSKGFGAATPSALGVTGETGPGKTRPGQSVGRAKSVIFLFMEGGPSHLDLLDPKPLLNKLAGQKMPESFVRPISPMGEGNSPLLGEKRKWARHGKSGLWMSDWIPNIATCADDIAVIRSCKGEGINHSSGVCQMNTGSIVGGRPSLGSWVSYGLGSEADDLPAFVVLQDGKGPVVNGPRNWSAGFMSAVHQGTRLESGREPIQNLFRPDGVTAARERSKLNLLGSLNTEIGRQYPTNTELDARIRGYELAFRMQAGAPDAVDLSRETQSTHELYGTDRPETESFGRLCLLGRRLVERGVRFVQLYHGPGSRWDAHSGIEKNHTELCRAMDRPVAALLKDLKARGMLEETLVIWGGEFGRTPMSEKGDGRDHNPNGFSMFMAGGGIKGGIVHGETDELGLYAIRDKVHVHDLHATILHSLGLDNMKLVYNHGGRPERPTLNEGEPVRALFV